MATDLKQSFIFPKPLSSYDESGRRGIFNSTREDVDPASLSFARGGPVPVVSVQPNVLPTYDAEMV